MTTATTRAPSTKAQLAQALELIATLQAQLATNTASTTSTTVTNTGASNQLGDKTFARPILELVSLEADYRSDEEVARGMQLFQHEVAKRAQRWAMERRAFYANLYAGAVACSGITYVAPVSGKWPVDHDGFTFGDKVAGSYIAIY